MSLEKKRQRPRTMKLEMKAEKYNGEHRKTKDHKRMLQLFAKKLDKLE